MRSFVTLHFQKI